MYSVIIVAAGSGRRMHLDINKQFIKLREKRNYCSYNSSFYENINIDEIVVCIKKEEEDFFKENIINKYNFKNIKIAYGGKERQDSIYNGLKELDKNCDIVLIHDGARPFVDHRIINESIKVAKEKKGCGCSVPVSDTIKIVSDGTVQETPERSLLWQHKPLKHLNIIS
ncbi:IspD/TarI family cytidylyltransferase [Clostridioides difficile]|uniref:IspD/TarI family cytidylyltransferase n=1 Tax=Clostridioides difficile TaxID=1496 RepID=UPI002236FE99|nr:IspD/TarI family cytidylyltransferase [Clostridioides difficile]